MQTAMASLSRFCAIHLLGALMLTVIITASATRALAQNQLIASVASMEDSTATLRIEDVVHQDFRPVGHTVAMGYTTSAQWLRLRILPADDGGEVVLIYRGAQPDSLRFYVPVSVALTDTGTRRGGLQHESMVPDWPSPIPGYRLSPPPGGADYFVRVQSSGAITLSLSATSVAAAIVATERVYFLQIAYLTTMSLVMFWALQMFMISRLNLFGWFAALQFVWVGNNIFYAGYFTKMVPSLTDDAHMVLFRMSVFGATFLSIAFHRNVMARFEPPRMVLRLFDIQLGVIAIALAIFWIYSPTLGLQVNAACIAVTPMIFIAASATARKKIAPGLLLMRICYGLLSLSILLNSFTVLGLINSMPFALYGFMIHGLVTAMVIVVFLHVTAQEMVATADAAKTKRREMEQQNAFQEEKTRAFSQFIEMLGHEAKNALAVIKMSMSSRMLTEAQYERSDGAIRGLTNVIDRCNQVIRLDKNEQILSAQACDLSEILKRLSISADNSGRIILKVQGSAVVQSDPVLLEVVFSNLLENAIKYARPESDIYVSLIPEDGGHSILFENMQGSAGMPDPDRVFERYYRSTYARADIGSGLGLYIVRGLVQLMGARVDYLPEDNVIRFKVWFPC